MDPTTIIEIGDSSRIAEVRRKVVSLAERQGLSATAVSNCGIVATELATNLSKHAQRGEVHILPLSARGLRGVEILGVDRGPGMSNLEQCLADGYSTGGTSGTGLGAMQRLSTEFDAYSLPGKGTVLAVRIMEKDPAATGAPTLVIGIAAKPLNGETVSGDGWAVRSSAAFALLVVADGLGHGAQAADASNEALRTFLRSSDETPVGLLQLVHGALRGSRGAAVSIARIDFDLQQVRFAGLGNVAGVVISSIRSGSPKLHSMVSHNGTAGHEARHMKEFVYSMAPDDLILMHSDGLASHWNLAATPGLLVQHPSVIAGALYRDYARERDDVCVLVGKRR